MAPKKAQLDQQSDIEMEKLMDLQMVRESDQWMASLMETLLD